MDGKLNIAEKIQVLDLAVDYAKSAIGIVEPVKVYDEMIQALSENDTQGS